ncbi:MAG: Fic family protein [Chloroflexi bacterium]|nr:Fic family protein [Chloroflexota bacterium]
MPSWSVNFGLRFQDSNKEVVRAIAEAHALASVIREIPIPPSRSARLDALNIMRAVRGTTGIEGAELTEEEVEKILALEKPVLPPERGREEQETRNARDVMYFITEFVDKEPHFSLDEALVSQIHEMLTKNINYPNNIPGRYRDGPVAAGDYIPPAGGDLVRKLMSEFIQWFNEGQPAGWDVIVQALVAHFYLVSIHPFGDGNGRTARAVESLLLYKSMINARGFYSLSNFYYKNREDYIRHLDYVRFQSDGDLTPFVLFALRGLVEELKIVHREVLESVRSITFNDYAREYIEREVGLSSLRGRRLLFAILDLKEPTRLAALKASPIYRDVGVRTILRDISFLLHHKLITFDGPKKELRAYVESMTQFTPPFELMPKTRRPGRIPRKSAPK